MDSTLGARTGIFKRFSNRPVNESFEWLPPLEDVPLWSRRSRRIASGSSRNPAIAKFKDYHVEIPGRLWSLWGSLHPEAPVFEKRVRGRQCLACYVVACCAASAYPLMDWNPQLLDSIVVSGSQYFKKSIKPSKQLDCELSLENLGAIVLTGSKYFEESIRQLKKLDYELSLENLDTECSLDSLKFEVHIEHVCCGKLYRVPSLNRMNLSRALIYFFSHFQFGVLTVKKRALAIGLCPGYNGGYFMYDCQQKDFPLFPPQQGASYVLRTCNLQDLLFYVVVTLNVPFQNIRFSIYKVDAVCKNKTKTETINIKKKKIIHKK